MIDQTEQILAMLDSGHSFLVVTHENPDGDAIGAALALTLALRDRGKQATAYDTHPMPNYLTWLPGADALVDTIEPADYDVICICDCGAPSRVGPRRAEILAHPRIVNIDHHYTNEGYGHANLVNENASSTSEILFALLRRFGAPLTPSIVTNLYLGIYTDTTMFQNSATNPNALKVCGELVAAGADFLQVAKRVYIDSSAGRLRMLGRVLSTLQLDQGGKIAGVVCTRQDMEEFGMRPDDLETFVEYPRSVIGADVAYLLREEDNTGLVKGSFRSNTDLDVSQIAKALGGGGHKKAAGFKTTGTLTEIRRRVIDLLGKAMEAN